MRIRIVCYEDIHEWILGKFAVKLQENLSRLNISADIDKIPDLKADINHHIIYNQYNGKKSSIDTLMITHVDNIEKLELLKKHIKVAALGICMSSETMNFLANMDVDKNKLCYVNPAHDHLVKIKKYIIGITCRVQIDGRKRESFLCKLADDLDPKYFIFKIMGDSWDPQISYLRKKGFEVEYFDHFIREEYYPFITSLDYYLYMGMDEGQMGFIDAVAAGVSTIVTPQGYHLDAGNAITHPFTSYEQLREIFLKLQKERSLLINSVSSWNWYDYTIKHVELWEYILGNRNIKSKYADGLNSLIAMSKKELKQDEAFVKSKRRELKRANIVHQFLINKNVLLKEVKLNGPGKAFIKILKRLAKIILRAKN